MRGGGWAFRAEHPVGSVTLATNAGQTALALTGYLNHLDDVGVGPVTNRSMNSLSSLIAGADFSEPFYSSGISLRATRSIGSGWSARLDNIREYTADRHKRDLEAIVKMIHAPRVILIGQSWGAVLATLLAADDPGLVAAMIVTGPGPIQPTRRELVALTPPDSLHLHDPYYSNRQGNDLANNIRTHVMALMATQYGVKLASDKEADDFAGYLNVMVNRSTVYDTSRIRQMNAYNGAGYYAMVMTVHSFRKVRDPRPKLKDSPIPILVMKGQYDNQPWGFTHEYLDLFPNHRLVVFRDAGHCIFCEQREGYLSTIREFLREQDSLGR